ncbi:MAG TPA: hypothetical protein VD970_15105 [Acetobacteraceae bacterium]|nr:hypothetical protein [Acetobacteraceae bacterium]
MLATAGVAGAVLHLGLGGSRSGTFQAGASALAPPQPAGAVSATRRIGSQRIGLPIAEGHCELDRDAPNQREFLDQVRTMSRNQTQPLLVTAPCTRLAALSGKPSSLAAQRVIVMTGVSAVAGQAVARGNSRDATLANIRATFRRGWMEQRDIAIPGGRGTRVFETAHVDDNAAYVRMRIRVDERGQVSEICGMFGVTELAGHPFAVMIIEGCDRGGLVTAARELIERLPGARPAT